MSGFQLFLLLQLVRWSAASVIRDVESTTLVHVVCIATYERRVNYRLSSLDNLQQCLEVHIGD